ncbi:MAG: phosphate ABC transporter permease subunit PstC [Planctomycetales bacterium]|nr:phosphate ABC transporter permease subunit PstC [Planctomycetales bacterium]
MNTQAEMSIGQLCSKFRVKSSKSSHRWQRFVLVLLVGSAFISLATTVGIIAMLAVNAWGFFGSPEIELSRFLSDTTWTIGQTQGAIRYGIWPLLSGTLRITVIAMFLALPLGLITAIYLSEFAARSTRAILKPALELLAGIPTVVLGFFAIVFITPFLQNFIDDGFKTFNAASAGIAVGILCIPLVSSLSEDALQAVPRSLREGAYGLGATRFETTVFVVLPAATSGIVSAFLLALARAIGETMVVALAAGSTPTYSLDPRLQSQTMTGYIVNTFQSDTVTPGTVAYHSVYAVAVVLFLLTLTLTLLGQWVRRRFREVYQ